jgi:hypothetical protein
VLFSDRGLLTMLHGLVLSGGALLLLIVALFACWAFAGPGQLTVAPSQRVTVPPRHAASLRWLLIVGTLLLWLTVISGTYVIFPLYRAPAPEGITVLTEYPRALLMAGDDTRWLHAFGMEIKEHVPWIAAMLSTALVVVARRNHDLLAQPEWRRLTMTLLVVVVLLVTGAALLGTFVNKVAPLW